MANHADEQPRRELVTGVGQDHPILHLPTCSRTPSKPLCRGGGTLLQKAELPTGACSTCERWHTLGSALHAFRGGAR